MGSPTNSFYYGPVGQDVYAGRNAWPAWRSAMAANTWAQIPGNTLSSIDPENSPAINPNYPGQSPWRAGSGQSAVVNDWAGACWDDSTQSMWFPLQGGHSDYGGNEPYRHRVNQATPSFVMLRNPSGAIGDEIVLNDGQESTGLYSDGRLRSVHSYNNNVFAPGLGPVICAGVFDYLSGAGGFERVYLLNETTGEATLLYDYSALYGIGTMSGAGTYDSLRNCIWLIGVGQTVLLRVSLPSGTTTATVSSNNYVGSYARTVYLPQYDLVAVVQSGANGYPQSFYLWDVSQTTPIVIQPTLTGSWSSGLQTAAPGQVGMDWNGSELLIWDNTTNTTDVSVLAPSVQTSSGARTQPWTKSVISAAGSNVVTPTVRASTGTYGRWAYSATLGGCYLLNDHAQQAYFYATQ